MDNIGLIRDLPKTACVDALKKCNEIEPFNESFFEHENNPATNEPYNDEERAEKMKQFNNMCSLKNTKVINCCDPNNKLYGQYKNDMKNFLAKKIKKRGEIVGYKLCNLDNNECDINDESYKELTPHDMCKISSSVNKIKNGDLHINKVVPDCYSSVCSKQRYVPFINDPFAVKVDNTEEYNMLQELKNDNVDGVKKYYNDNGLNMLNHTLKNGYSGNTVLHEAIAYNSEKVLDFILENKLDYDKKNIDGNTPLHIAVLKGNEYITYRLIKFGSNIQKENNLGDSVLHSAVRGGNLKIVNILLHNNSSVFVKNKLGETPLHTAIMTPEKNIKIIITLANQGSDLKTQNNNRDTLIGSLQRFKKTKNNEAIRTFIQQKIYKSSADNYTNLLRESPELTFIEAVDRETGELDNISKYTVENIKVEMPRETIADSQLYGNKKSIATKESMNIEGFTASQLPDPIVLENNVKDVYLDVDLDKNVNVDKEELKEEDIESIRCDTKCVFKYSTFILFILLFLVIVLKFAL